MRGDLQPPVEATAAAITEDRDVQQALKRVQPAPPPPMSRSAVVLLLMLVTLAVLGPMAQSEGASAWLRGAVNVLLVLIAARLIDDLLLGRVHDVAARYNLRRILHLATAAGCLLVLLGQVFVNWYAGILSVGVVSLILSLSLQPAVTSFLGWIYLMIRAPYRVGDRIQIGEAQGDVIEVGYLDTTLWEFGGPYLSTDHPSGRLIRFPNSMVLQSRVFNYSWPLFPYIWNEIKLSVAYDADLEFVERVMRETVSEDMGEVMIDRVRVYRELLAQTPVDELTVGEHPTVVFRPNPNLFIDAIVRYLVDPRQQGRVKTRLFKKILARLNEQPAKARFPEGTRR
jgi:small-conductance mechanosensitive channel